MAIRVYCPHCGKKLKGPDELAGREVKCPRCLAKILIPGSDRKSQTAVQAEAPPVAISEAPTIPPTATPDEGADIFLPEDVEFSHSHAEKAVRTAPAKPEPDWTPKFSAGFLGVAVMLFLLTTAGLWFANRPKRGQDKQPDFGSEAEAREILKTALDSWRFGDSIEKLERNHPQVAIRIIHFPRHFFTEFGATLLKYEITGGRKIDLKKSHLEANAYRFEFTVILTGTTERGAELKNERLYRVFRGWRERSWVIECRDVGRDDDLP